MADNVQITEGLGTVVATDDCGSGGHAQIVKLAIAADGSATAIPSDAITGMRVHVKALDIAPPPHSFGYTQQCKGSQHTVARTGTALWTPDVGLSIAVQSYQISIWGPTAADVVIWFGGAADTTFTRGTDKAIIDARYVPTKFGNYADSAAGIWKGAADQVLRITSSAAVSVNITVWGYEF